MRIRGGIYDPEIRVAATRHKFGSAIRRVDQGITRGGLGKGGRLDHRNCPATPGPGKRGRTQPHSSWWAIGPAKSGHAISAGMMAEATEAGGWIGQGDSHLQTSWNRHEATRWISRFGNLLMRVTGCVAATGMRRGGDLRDHPVPLDRTGAISHSGPRQRPRESRP
jgi:hypothetical protein